MSDKLPNSPLVIPDPTRLAGASPPIGGEIVTGPDMDPAKVQLMFAHPIAFPTICQIVREDDSVGYMNPTLVQRLLLEAWDRYRWIMVTKYRQAKVTTAAVMQLLRDCMYIRGMKGLLVAEREETVKDVFERIMFAYQNLPDDVRMPLAKGRKGGSTQLHFSHGGNIKILTLGGLSPGISRGIGRVVITEFGETQRQSMATRNLFPAFNKRPNARIMLESTPGVLDAPHQTMWNAALQGKGRFVPIFFQWWKDPTCRTPVSEGFAETLTPDELRLMDRHPEMLLENVHYRRRCLETEFLGDPRLFASKYPEHPRDGWLGQLSPVMPTDVLEEYLRAALVTPAESAHGCCEYAPPYQGTKFIITADPAGFGAAGDPSGLIVWDGVDRVDMAVWNGREDPGRFARRLMRVRERYTVGGRAPLTVVESNAAACIQSLRDMGCRGLFWTNSAHPGWYATENRLQEAEARLVRLLRDRELTIRSAAVLDQLLKYDGSRKRRSKGLDDQVHHFDLARCAIIGADIMSRRRFTKTAVDAATEDEFDGPRPITIKDLDRFDRRQREKILNPFRPPSTNPEVW